MKCIVCDKEASRYRCRHCKSCYCSAACFKNHREVPEDNPSSCAAVAKADETQQPDAKRPRPEVCTTEDLFSDATRDAKMQAPAPIVASSGASPRDHGDDVELGILSEKHLTALANNKKIRNALKSKELRTMLKTIDRSRSRLDALDAALHNSVDFKQFCDAVMSVIAAAEGIA